MRQHVIWSVLIIAALAITAYAIFSPSKPEYEYITEEVSRGSIIRKVSASGKLRALNTIKVGAEVSGQVTQVFVDFNSPVKKGQVLAVIDPTRIGAQVNQGQAQVAAAQANLRQAQANGSRARADLILQERNFARRGALAKEGFLSKADLDLAEAQLNAARNAVNVGQAQISGGAAQIQQANAQLSSSRAELNRTRIIAPASGVIINKLVEPGTTVAANFQTPNLFEIAADINKMQVEASVDEADIGQVKEGQPVTFTVDSHPDDIFNANVRQVRQAPVETQNVVSYLVIIDVDNVAGKLLPGMTANVEIITDEKSGVTRVPTAALRFQPKTSDLPADSKADSDKAADGDGQGGKEGRRDGEKDKRAQFVYIATTDAYKPRRRPVTIGIRGDDYTEILTGVATGQKILVRSKSLKPKPDSQDDDDTAA